MPRRSFTHLGLPRVAALAVAMLAAVAAQAGPVVPCGGGPDPLRYRPAVSLPVTSLDAAPVAVAAAVDPSDGREFVAVAFLTPSGEVVVMVSGDGLCSFGTSSGGLGLTYLTAGPVTETPAVALRVDAGVPLLAVAWRDGDVIVVRTTSSFATTFSTAHVFFEAISSAPSAPRLAVSPAPTSPTLALAWLVNSAGARVLRTSTNATAGDPAQWTAPLTPSTTLAADLGVGAELALSADATGTSGQVAISLLATVTLTGAAHATRSDDGGATFAPWRRVDDGSLVRPMSPTLASASGPSPGWTGLAWTGRARLGPAVDRVSADAALADAGVVTSDFDGALASANPIEASPIAAGARVTNAVAGGALFTAWSDTGEVFASRRPLADVRPRLQGGCGSHQVTGVDPPRTTGTARAPAAAALGDDVVIAFADTRGGSAQAYVLRSDSRAPVLTGILATPAPCGPPSRITVGWDAAPCDAISVVVELGLTPGATDLTRNAAAVTDIGLLVEGLEPGTTYFVRLRATDGAGNVGVSEEVSATTPSCSNAKLDAVIVSVTDACPFGGAGGNGLLEPGETARLRIRVTNSGTETAPLAVLSVLSRQPLLHVRTPPLALGDIAAGAFVEADVDVDASATGACDPPWLVLLRMQAGGAAWAERVAIPARSACVPCRAASCSVTADATRSAPLTICQGETMTLDANASTSTGCAGILLHDWSDGGGTYIATGPTLARTPGASTTYGLTSRCSTDLACTGTTSVSVTVNPLPSLSLATDPPPPHCEGDTVVVNAITTDPSLTYAWSDATTGPSVTVTADGVVSVTVTDSNGCRSQRSLRINFGIVPVADAGPDAGGCGGVLIGTTAYPLLDYRWSPPDGLSSPYVARPLARPATPTDYTLTVSDPATGCSSSDTVRVAVSAGPGPLQDLRVFKSPAGLRMTWTPPPASSGTRIYVDDDARRAASANSASPTATLWCEGTTSCSASMPAMPLTFLQAVSLCPDGASEGPN